jgi:hypothetical protein
MADMRFPCLMTLQTEREVTIQVETSISFFDIFRLFLNRCDVIGYTIACSVST